VTRHHVERTIRVLKDATRSITTQIAIIHWLWMNDYGPHSDGVKRSSIEDEIGESLDHTIRISLDHLGDLGLVEEYLKRDTTYVIAEWHPDVFIMGQVEEAAAEGIEALIDDIQDRDPADEDTAVAADGAGISLRQVVADRFGLFPDAVEEHLRDGDPVERLNEAVDAIQESEDFEVGDGYGEVTFRNPAYRYRLTEAAQRLYSL
jgi:hypothetical protein